ncbi:DUF2147 domain-containing protein [Francisella tularensis subsp. novicida FSC159]|uniref:DUF2147 domain-containing protein n=1 Tax=Francisella tularensis TaxID=263 RepID=UPI001C0F0AEB|nr:DUF2147 domain-containing protein [Francisella tularensis]MBK2110731.1 DUF2147 domain-containing protein [Francisella tularensis subsp. novicida FSC159]
MLRKLMVIIVAIFVFSFAYTEEDWQGLYATGYWLQRDGVTKTNIAVIHAYDNQNGNLNAEVYVPLSNVDDGIIHEPIIYCEKCGKGDAYGNLYDYSSGKDKYQGLEFVWNAKKTDNGDPAKGKGPLYTDGAVLNPHDGKYYHVKARTIEYGKKIYVRAYWGFLGKSEHWQRISADQAQKIKNLCGLTADNVYTYEDKNGKVNNKELFKECATRNFVKNPL